ncbi:MAG: PAS domain-containing protein, partial [Selenomonadaceae bacterium]|nr:PAS domain-containing protein [Selenomonadaceae bacterium]
MQEHLDEDMLQALLGDIGDGIVLTDREEKVLYLNRAAKRILSYQGKVGGDLYFDEICPLVNLKTRKAFDSPLQIAMRERRSLGLARNIGICTMEGSMYLSATCSPIYGKDGEVQGCSVLLRDVTHLRKLEMKLEANHIYMRSVFEAAKTGLCVLSSDGAIMDLNDAAIEIMESSYKEIIGLQFGDAFHCENSI